MVPMDACHLLLSRPWQYDRQTIHDGYKNTYTFVKDGIKITLGLMKVENVSKPSHGEEDNFLSLSGFKREMQAVDQVYALVILDHNEDHPNPPVIMKDLKQFVDVIPEETPPGLPPMRDI